MERNRRKPVRRYGAPVSGAVRPGGWSCRRGRSRRDGWSGRRWKGPRSEVVRRRRESRQDRWAGASGRRGAGPSRRSGHPRTVRHPKAGRRPYAVRRRARGAACRGDGQSPKAACRPGDERPVGRPGSGPTPRAGRPGNGSEPSAERSGNGSRTPGGSPGSGRRRPGAAGWPRCPGSGPPCAGSRRSAGVRLGAGRCHRPRRGRAGESRPPPPHPNHVRGPARPPDRSRVRGSARPPAGILARGRPDRRNSGCSPGCSGHRPYPGGVRPGSCPESGKAPRTDEAACWVARAHPPPVAAEGGVARSDRSRPRARDPGGAGEPRGLPPGWSRTEGPSRAHPGRTDTCPGRSRTPPASRCRTRALATAAAARLPVSRCSMAWRPGSWSTRRGPAVWTGGADPVGAGGWRRDALPCSCTPRFLVRRPGGRPGVRPPVGSGRHAYPGAAPSTVRRHHGQAIPVAADPHPRRGRPCVRVTLRAGPGRTGTSPPTRGFCPERPPTLR